MYNTHNKQNTLLKQLITHWAATGVIDNKGNVDTNKASGKYTVNGKEVKRNEQSN